MALTPILTSAGIVGVALAFGAQTLVKDLLAGLFIILEDQYGVGDTIQGWATTFTNPQFLPGGSEPGPRITRKVLDASWPGVRRGPHRQAHGAGSGGRPESGSWTPRHPHMTRVT